jgi:hypothetical protein
MMWFEAKTQLPEKDGLYLCWHRDWSMEVVRYRKCRPGINGFDTMGAGGNLPMFGCHYQIPQLCRVLKITSNFQ